MAFQCLALQPKTQPLWLLPKTQPLQLQTKTQPPQLPTNSMAVGKIPVLSTVNNSSLPITIGGLIGTNLPSLFAWHTHFGTAINLAGHRSYAPFVPIDDQQHDNTIATLCNLSFSNWADHDKSFLSLTPGTHAIFGHLQAPMLVDDGKKIPNLVIMLQELLVVSCTLDAYGNQAHTGICYQELSGKPVNFLAVVKLYMVSGNTIKHCFLTVLCCPGTMKFDIPWNPAWDSDDGGMQFLLMQHGANIHAAMDGDIDDPMPLSSMAVFAQLLLPFPVPLTVTFRYSMWFVTLGPPAMTLSPCVTW
jgi:hypothetical protein